MGIENSNSPIKDLIINDKLVAKYCIDKVEDKTILFINTIWKFKRLKDEADTVVTDDIDEQVAIGIIETIEDMIFYSYSFLNVEQIPENTLVIENKIFPIQKEVLNLIQNISKERDNYKNQLEVLV